MKIKIKQDDVLIDTTVHKIGDIVDVEDHTAKRLISAGAAVEIGEVIETAELKPETEKAAKRTS